MSPDLAKLVSSSSTMPVVLGNTQKTVRCFLKNRCSSVLKSGDQVKSLDPSLRGAGASSEDCRQNLPLGRTGVDRQKSGRARA